MVSSLVTGAVLAMQALVGGGVHLRGIVVDQADRPLGDVVVELVQPGAVLPRMATLTASDGAFAFDSGDVESAVRGRASLDGRSGLVVDRPGAGPVVLDLTGLRGERIVQRSVHLPGGRIRVEGLAALVPAGRSGVFLVRAREGGSGAAVVVGGLGARPEALRWLPEPVPAARAMTDSVAPGLSLRKAGFLRRSVAVPSLAHDAGRLVLARDPLEDRVDSVLSRMDLDDKLGQMTQGVIGTGSLDLGASRLGSLLSGGGDSLPDHPALQDVALGTPRAIPMIYGIDAVHGTAKVANAVVFPHHIGLGATRDSALVRRVGEVTATEMLASGTDWAFAPCIAVPQDDRWGRTYEGFGETPELAAMLGAAEIRGLQGARVPWNVIACAKHFVADGGTTWGTGTQATPLDQGDARIPDSVLRRVHLPGYVAAVREGVGTVMASYSLVRGVRNHAHRDLLTGVLKTELGFDGFVISDWLAIGQIDKLDYASSVRQAIEAGVDMAMEPNQHRQFLATLKTLVQSGKVSQARIDDAVRRILRVKFRSGRMDSPHLPRFLVDPIGAPAHRAVAREAVRRSLVVLENDPVAGVAPLPLPPGGTIAVHGSHADDAGLQCGGWTLGWQGKAGKVPGATTLLGGLREVLGTSRVVSQATRVADAKVAVFVVGEPPYAEMKGDLEAAAFADFRPDATTSSLMAAYRTAGVPVVTVFVTGRARPVATLLAASDAFVVAWLPGSEGAGVADVLSGAVAPSGLLPVSWPLNSQPIANVGDGRAVAFPYGFGLTWP